MKPWKTVTIHKQIQEHKVKQVLDKLTVLEIILSKVEVILNQIQDVVQILRVEKVNNNK